MLVDVEDVQARGQHGGGRRAARALCDHSNNVVGGGLAIERGGQNEPPRRVYREKFPRAARRRQPQPWPLAAFVCNERCT